METTDKQEPIKRRLLSPKEIEHRIRLDKIKWENRRKMAWTSLISMIIQTILLLFAPPSILSNEKIEIIKEPLTWAYMCESTVILAYMGFTTLAYLKEKSMKNNPPA